MCIISHGSMADMVLKLHVAINHKRNEFVCPGSGAWSLELAVLESWRLELEGHITLNT